VNDVSSGSGDRRIVGFLLLLAGAMLFVDKAFNVDDLWRRWWPALLIVWGVARLAIYQSRGWFFSLALVGAGLLLTADKWSHQFDIDAGAIIALALILLGAHMVFRHRKESSTTTDTTSDTIHGNSVFGGYSTVVRSASFRGGEVSTIFGSAEIDLTQAELAREGARLTVSATFGSVEMSVPDSWELVISATPILGSVEDQRKRAQGGISGAGAIGARTLTIEGTATFGSIVVK